MVAQQKTRPAPFGAITVYQVVDVFDRLLFALRSRISARQTRRRLEVLTDAQLDDVGLRRTDIDRVAAWCAGL
jgi:uncharacterized protein YjiS (DUF1127 family)